MDLVEEILMFAFALRAQEDNPLRDDLQFCLFEDAASPPSYEDT